MEKTPTLNYLSLTLTYYTLTEPRVQTMIPNLLMYVPNIVEKVQGLEQVYAGIMIRGATIFMSVCVLLPLLPHFRLVSLTLFTNVYRPYKALKVLLATLKYELGTVAEFREASPEEIDDYEDVWR